MSGGFTLGEFPPLDTLPSTAFTRGDVQVLIQLVDARWRQVDTERHGALLPAYRMVLLDEQAHLERILDKLKAVR
jgi:hypothetical protein